MRLPAEHWAIADHQRAVKINPDLYRMGSYNSRHPIIFFNITYNIYMLHLGLSTE